MFSWTWPPPSARLPQIVDKYHRLSSVCAWCVCWQNTVAVKVGRVDTNKQCQTGLTDERSTQQSNLTAAIFIWPQQKTVNALKNKHFWPIWPIWPINYYCIHDSKNINRILFDLFLRSNRSKNTLDHLTQTQKNNFFHFFDFFCWHGVFFLL